MTPFTAFLGSQAPPLHLPTAVRTTAPAPLVGAVGATPIVVSDNQPNHAGFVTVVVGPVAVAAAAAALRKHGGARSGHRRARCLQLRATTVEMETTTNLAPWEIDEETEEEKQERYKREADEMKLKWDARRLEEKQSAARRRAWAAKEQERAALYGPRDLPMEAYDARMYEEARVIEVRRRQREVYERIKAYKRGQPLPPKGEPYVPLKPPPVRPPAPEDFDVSGRYDQDAESAELVYCAPENFKSPSGPRPPPRHLRGAPRAAWEDPPYGPPSRNAQPGPRGPPPRAGPPPSAPPPKAPPSGPPPGPPPSAKKEDPVEEEVEEVEEQEVEEEPEVVAANLPTAEEAKKMKVSELKAALKEANLPATGNKAALLERLLEAIG